MKKKLKYNETQVLKMLRQLRYGQLNINLSNFHNENIKRASEKLLEALSDRELMLQEYKQTLLKKNKSLEQMIEFEKESQKFKEDFVAALTHDLKTPVIAELNAIKLLLGGKFGELNHAQTEILEMMLKSDKDLIELSEMILNTYKYQQTEIVLNKSQTNIRDFVQEVFEELYPILDGKNQKHIFINETENFDIEIDTMHFKRVLHNLILNASKYGYFDTDVIVKLTQYEDYTEISVINSGETLKEEDVKLIFEKYYSGIKKFSQLGTGLGLYCANKIVKAHNGTIEVSAENDRTIFTVNIPND
ncbi:MAG: sensor histidine kinase [Candidatus Gastranaerophilaceae bacterium]